MLHLYAGENADYTFARAMKDVSGTARNVLEIDVKRGENHDMKKASCYGALLRLTLDGCISAVLGGPNCRTRSVLRTYPGGPPQTRRWNGGEFGDEGISAEEQEKIDHDDEMMWKMILIYLVAEAARKVRYGKQKGKVSFLLEQPGPPWYKPEVVSFWWTPQWEELQRRQGLWLLEVNQGDYGGEAVKPTGPGTNLDVEPGHLVGRPKSRPEDGSGDSKALARWTPGLMKAIALAVYKEINGKMSQRAIRWQEHLRAGHVPFHRDCRVCQQAAARDGPHRRLKHAKAAVLSLDLAGPLRKEKDHTGPKRYILVGAYTWIEEKHKVTSEESPPVEEGAPVIDEVNLAEDDEPGPPQDEILHEAADGEEEDADPGGPNQPEEEMDQDFGIEVFRLAVPVEDRSAEKILEATIYLYLQLRADGYPVQQIHTDRAREFMAKGFTRA